MALDAESGKSPFEPVSRASVIKRVQWAVARAIRRFWPADYLWWDVATFTVRGLTCATCARVSHTERVHITHDCDEVRA